MSLEQRPQHTRQWDGTVPRAFDARILAIVVLASGLAASLNVQAGGLVFAVVAFGLLVLIGSSAHVLAQRRLRRATTAIATHWSEAGLEVQSVTRNVSWLRTEWAIKTPDGTVIVGGFALLPFARLTITADGVTDAVAIPDPGKAATLAREWRETVLAR